MMKVLWIAGLVTVGLGFCACAIPQRLDGVEVRGHVIALDSGSRIAGAKVRLVYHGPTKDLPARKGDSQFIDSIGAASTTSDQSGGFVLRTKDRVVRRTLGGFWQAPVILVSALGFEDTMLTEMDLSTRYNIKYGTAPSLPWPYLESVEVYLKKRPNKSPEPTPTAVTPRATEAK